MKDVEACLALDEAIGRSSQGYQKRGLQQLKQKANKEILLERECCDQLEFMLIIKVSSFVRQNV